MDLFGSVNVLTRTSVRRLSRCCGTVLVKVLLASLSSSFVGCDRSAGRQSPSSAGGGSWPLDSRSNRGPVGRQALKTNQISTPLPALPPGATPIPPPDPRQAEFDALKRMIFRGREDDAIATLESHPEWVHYCNATTGSLLTAAAGCGRIRMVEYLLDHGADPNVRTPLCPTPLDACLCSAINADEARRQGVVYPVERYDAVFELLLARGANPNVRMPLYMKMFTEYDVITAADDLFEIGMKLQRSPTAHASQRNAMLAALRHHRGLPVDAMLPINADSRYIKSRDPVRN